MTVRPTDNYVGKVRIKHTHIEAKCRYSKLVYMETQRIPSSLSTTFLCIQQTDLRISFPSKERKNRNGTRQ